MKIFFSITILLLISGCTTTTHPVVSTSCKDSDFVSSQPVLADCQKEICKDGKVVLEEDLIRAAPVDDWAEEKFCLLHLINCYKAYVIKQKVVKWTETIADEKKYWDRKSLHNGIGDGARHLYAGCLLAKEFGSDFARKTLLVHEEDSGHMAFGKKGETNNPCCEKMMDIYNNEIGISLAGKPGTCEEKVLSSLSLLRYSLCGEGKKEQGKTVSNAR